MLLLLTEAMLQKLHFENFIPQSLKGVCLIFPVNNKLSWNVTQANLKRINNSLQPSSIKSDSSISSLSFLFPNNLHWTKPYYFASSPGFLGLNSYMENLLQNKEMIKQVFDSVFFCMFNDFFIFEFPTASSFSCDNSSEYSHLQALFYRFQNVNRYCSVLFKIVFCTSFGVTSGLQQPYLFASAMSHAAYHSGCCTDGESIATLRMNRTLAPTHQCRARGRMYRFWSLRHDPTGNRNHPTSFSGACSTNFPTSLHWWRVNGSTMRGCFFLHQSINAEHEAGQQPQSGTHDQPIADVDVWWWLRGRRNPSLAVLRYWAHGPSRTAPR